MSIGISIGGGFGGEKEKTRETPQPFLRTEELWKLFRQFRDDFYGRRNKESYEDALSKASGKLQSNIGKIVNRYERDVTTPRKGYFQENRGLLSNLISETEANRKPINIGFGGEDVMSFTPHTKKLADLVGQRSDMEGAHFTGMGKDVGYIEQLLRDKVNAGLMPKQNLMQFYKDFLLPLETARFGSRAVDTSSHAYGGNLGGAGTGGTGGAGGSSGG